MCVFLVACARGGFVMPSVYLYPKEQNTPTLFVLRLYYTGKSKTLIEILRLVFETMGLYRNTFLATNCDQKGFSKTNPFGHCIGVTKPQASFAICTLCRLLPRVALIVLVFLRGFAIPNAATLLQMYQQTSL